MMERPKRRVDPKDHKRGKGVIDLTGMQFGRLTAVEHVGTKHRAALWLCLCQCGNSVNVDSTSLRNGSTKSCKCLTKELSSKRARTHGCSRQGQVRLYNIWQKMKDRCFNTKSHDYPRYGGRGITVCDRWLIFENFLADMGNAPKPLSLERENNNGNYEPQNCIWATAAIQAVNRRNTVNITWQGRTQCGTVWARELGIPYSTIRARILKGKTAEEILRNIHDTN